MASNGLEGVFKSLRVYHGPNAPRAAMDALYTRYVARGDLVFDIGAHVGDRVSSFRRLGARVVAVEPQPLLQRALRLIHGNDRAVLIEAVAVGAQTGEMALHINTHNPTVSTLSAGFVADAEGAEGWEGQSWDQRLIVPVVTLDSLIARHGVPAFVKVDVEGFEDQVLAGLSAPLPALSFEFTTIARDVAQRSLAWLATLGQYRFDVALGESQRLTFERGVSVTEMSQYLEHLPHAANSGDVYAVRAASD